MKIDKKALLPHLISILVMIGIGVVYFSPAFEGYVLRQGDLIQGSGMAKEIADYRETVGGEPMWTNSMFGGMPAYHISMKVFGNLFSRTEQLLHIFKTPSFFFITMMITFYILMMTMKVRPYIAVIGSFAFAFSSFFVVSMEAGHVSKVHAISFMPLVFAGLFQVIKKDYLKGGILFAVGLSLQLQANHVQITYYTMISSFIFLIFYAIDFIKAKDFQPILRGGGVLLVGVILAVATNTTSLLTTYEYAKSTIRGKSELTISSDGGGGELLDKSGGLDRSYITRWSLGIDETLTLLIPHAKGGATGSISGYNPDALKDVSNQYKQYIGGQNSYWGEQPFTSGPTYVGATICLLFLLGMVTLKDRLKWPLLISVVLCIMLAWGKHFMWLTDLFIDYMPMYNKFRTVTMMLSVAELLMPIIAVLFINKLLTDKNFFEENKKKIFITGGALAGFILLLVIAPGAFFEFIPEAEYARFAGQQQSNPSVASQIDQMMDELVKARISIFKSDGFRSILLILLTMGGIVLAGMRKLKMELAIGVLFVLVLFDIWSVDKRYLNNEKARGKYISWIKPDGLTKPFRPTQNDLKILNFEKTLIPDFDQKVNEQIQELKKTKRKITEVDAEAIQFRVLNYNSHYRVFNVAENTFNSSKTSYFHKSVGGYHPAKLMRYQELIDFYINRATGKVNQEVLNMLNTKYIIMPDQNGGLQKNGNAYGTAWFVQNVKMVENADDEIQQLGKINPRNVALVDKRFESDISGFSPKADPSASIYLSNYLPNKMTYQTKASSDQFAVFSEIYYQPGWNAYIDGEPVNHVRADYVLRGMKVPAGEHTVEFVFEPSSYSLGEGIAYASSSLLILLLIGSFFIKEKQ